MPTVPLLASVADLNASVTSGGASQLVPSGVVMAFAGATAPTGWLLCGGALISRTTYADLFAAIGTAHGSGDGSTTFALPNYAGQFLRGRANGSANDPNRASRTAAATGGATGDNVGSVQGNATSKNGLTVSGGTASLTGTTSFATAGHDHESPLGSSDQLYAAAKFGNGANNATSVSGRALGATSSIGTISMWKTSTASASSSVGLSSTAAALGTGDAETRPLNAYVNYIIKI